MATVVGDEGTQELVLYMPEFATQSYFSLSAYIAAFIAHCTYLEVTKSQELRNRCCTITVNVKNMKDSEPHEIDIYDSDDIAYTEQSLYNTLLDSDAQPDRYEILLYCVVRHRPGLSTLIGHHYVTINEYGDDIIIRPV
jgi:hypothetical protein